MTSTTTTPRIGARVLLLDPDHRVLLIHARDPDDPAHHWWELPGGGLDAGETLAQAARREVLEETGIPLAGLGRELWVRECRFRYRGRDHHRVEHVFLAHTGTIAPQVPFKPTDNEKAGLVERRWWTAEDLARTTDKLLPAQLPDLLGQVLSGRFSAEPLRLMA